VALLDKTIARALPAVPRPVVRRISTRYIAGPSLDDAVRTVRTLNAGGKMATIDVLGEEITRGDEAVAICRQYHDVLGRIDDERLDSNISVKLTGLGLELDLALCRENLESVVRDARERGNFVRIDMEDSSTTDATLRLYRELGGTGFDNVGVVLQAYLRRTIDDVPGLRNVRLCKGIYNEPAGIAYQEYDTVRANFVRCLERLFDEGAYVAVATHDEELICSALRMIRERNLARDDYELQMLLGVREDRADQLVREGHRVRVYVPYGTHWYEYSLRRLQENPKIAGYIAADTLGRMLPRRLLRNE
jgi:proline dehydrogenase